MHNLAPELDVADPDARASHRHRAARTASFPAPPEVDYDAREAAYLLSLLADPLRELAGTTRDAGARSIAEAALAGGADVTADPFADPARFEEALERIAAATSDDRPARSRRTRSRSTGAGSVRPGGP